jgi:RNA polymerase subunit RPABC4/transcription elongation factor Spt4
MSGFCSDCGAPRLAEAKFCTGCGATLPPPVRFCPTCGQQWPHEESDPTVAPTTSGLPRGPAPGPDYVAGRDCGNCGFALEEATARCIHCGTSNTGEAFNPAG